MSTSRLANSRLVVLAMALAAFDCRCRTQYEPGVTDQCRTEAANAVRELPDAGVLDDKRLCDACCHKRGFDAVDPGSCECGKLGVDVLLK